MSRSWQLSKGSILIVVLWMLSILMVTAITLSRKTNVQLVLIERSLGKLQSRYIAWGGLVYSLAQMANDLQDKASAESDDRYRCAVHLERNQTLPDVFKNINVGNGQFDVAYQERDRLSSQQVDYPGFNDEERKLNLNALNNANVGVLVELLALLGVEESTAQSIAAATVDWRDTDDEVTMGNKGAEGAYYESLSRPFKVKNRPFDHLEELLLVKGMTLNIFDNLKDLVTVYPKEAPQLLINFSTASPLVLRALARNLTGPTTNTSPDDADSLVRKLMQFRAGDDGQQGTQDDQVIGQNEFELNAKEQALYLTMGSYNTSVSHYVRLKVRGVEAKGKFSTTIDAIIDRKNFLVLAWQRS